ncbi:ATP-dependent helicase [Clostridium niameyense]|uniref:ATP-dependent helicase n=1 Tax=Clostridium niameyense TaxID=1622073 RepID=UPI00067E92F5|nr:ATP-dependent helicase [Clostridium niameyense]
MVDYSFLDEHQKKAVVCEDKNILVVAPPGSGKTTVIINRVVYLTEILNINPNNIIVITFTRAAAMNMKQRYKAILNINRSPFFGTFHGLFYKILSRYYGRINIIEGKYSFNLINTILMKYLDTVSEDKIKDVLNDISVLKTSGQHLENFSSKIDKSIFVECYTKYEEYKKERELLDFDDLQINIFRLFKNNPRLLRSYRNLFKYILVDEFQDCDGLQIEILKMLGEGNSIFAVGDEDQCIYSFRGSKPECMVDFAKHFEDGNKEYLVYNYRSPNNIVDVSKKLISNNKIRNNKSIQAHRDENKKINISSFFNEREQAEYICKVVKDVIEKGYKYKEIAILYRTNMESRSITDVFFKHSIPFRLLDKGYNFFQHFVCRDILDYMYLSLDTRNRKAFLRIINKPFRYISKLNTEKVRNYKYDEDCFEILKSQSDIQPFQIKNIEDIQKDIVKISKMKATEAINFIMKNLDYESYIKTYSERTKIKKEELIEIVEELKESAEEYTSIIAFLAHVEEVEKEITKKDINEDSVILSTIHGVKGMEFKNVFVINCNEDNIPYKTSEGEINLEEERRLFYVAVTRTIEHLYICVPKLLRGKNKETSKFISECNLKMELEKSDIFSKGQRIVHRAFGEGIILNSDDSYINIRFLDGIDRSFDKKVLAEGHLIKIKE